MRKSAGRSAGGFSLLEMLLAIAVIGIVMGISMMKFFSVVPNYRANAGLSQVVSQLRSAREQAIAHRRQVQVEFPDNNHVVVTQVAKDGTLGVPAIYGFEGGAIFTTYGAIPDLPKPYNFGNGAPLFGNQPGGGTTWRFSPDGSFVDTATNTLANGTVFLGLPGNSGTARAISVFGATGRIRPYHWDGTAWSEE